MHAVQSVEKVVESVPALLRFPPEESLVVVTVLDGALHSVMRVDLAEVLGAGGAGAAEQFGRLALKGEADGVIVVLVSAEGSGCPICVDEFSDFAEGFGAALGRLGVELLDAVVVERIASGGRWRCVDKCGRGGVLSDPAVSVPAVAEVVAGRRVYGSRDEFKATVAADLGRRAVVSPLLNGVGRAVDCVPAAVAGVISLMERLAAGAVLSDAELASAGARLRDARVRDALLAASGDKSAAAEALWTVLARVLPPPFRAEALSLLAASAYRRGDGVLAGVALESALSESPEHRLSGLLDVALQSGIAPDDIAKVLDAGAVAAA